MVNHIKSKLAEQIPALCANEWTSRSRKRFMNIQAFIGGKKYSLGVMRITARATGVELLKMTQKFFNKYDIVPKFICTDGAANMGVCIWESGLLQLK